MLYSMLYNEHFSELYAAKVFDILVNIVMRTLSRALILFFDNGKT